MNGPNLSFLKRPGFREGLMSAGMAMMAQSDTPGSTVLGNLGRALPVGVQAGREAATREEYDALMEGAPPEMRQLLKILGPRDGAAFMLQQAMAGPADPIAVPEGTDLVDPITRQPVYTNDKPETPTEAPANVRIMEWLAEQTPEVRADYERIFGPAPATVINTGDRAASSASQALGGDAAQRITSKASVAEGSLSIAQNIQAAQQALDNPAMADVVGPGSNIKTVLERFSNDPRARELAAQYDILTSDLMLQTIRNFEGALSDRELAFIEKASAADRNMSVEELRAGLGLLRRIADRDLRAYVDEVEAFNPAEFGVSEEQMRQYRRLANRASDMLNTASQRQKYGLEP